VRTDRRVALADETRMMEPTQCMRQPELGEPLKDRFEVVETCVEEDHWWRYVLKCCECGQLYFFEFYELVDWRGDDPQYTTYVPADGPQEIERSKASSPLASILLDWKIVTEAPRPTHSSSLLRSYGRRKARPLSERKDRLLSELLPTLRLPLAEPAPSHFVKLFTLPVTEVWLEIGFGSGEHLVWQAEHHAHVGCIGCEPFINGVASLLGKIETLSLNTIRIHDGDARDVLAWLPPQSISRIFVLFPDPWPKKRHQKRRLISPDAVADFAQALRQGCEFRFATDSGDYAGEALLTILASGAFAWTAECAKDWRTRPPDWPETRYERKALSEGREPAYLSFRRL